MLGALMKWRGLGNSALEALGVATICVGLWQIWVPGIFLIIGIYLIMAANVAERRRKNDNNI